MNESTVSPIKVWACAVKNPPVSARVGHHLLNLYGICLIPIEVLEDGHAMGPEVGVPRGAILVITKTLPGSRTGGEFCRCGVRWSCHPAPQAGLSASLLCSGRSIRSETIDEPPHVELHIRFFSHRRLNRGRILLGCRGRPGDEIDRGMEDPKRRTTH